MIKDVGGLVCWLVGGLCLWIWSANAHVPVLVLPLVGISALLFDALLLTTRGKLFSRISPLLSLTLLLFGSPGFVVASLATLGGSLLLALSGKERRGIWGDLARSLGPLGAISTGLLALPDPFPTIALLLGFTFLQLLLEPRRFILRPTLLGLLAAPWIALAAHRLSLSEPWSLLLLLPVLIALSSGRDDAFPALVRLRQALRMSREQARIESEKARRFHTLLQAANLMARTLETEALRDALTRAARNIGIQGVKVYLPGEGPATGQKITLLDGKASLIFDGVLEQAQSDQLQILARMFGTCWENSELHAKVVEALEETRRSQAQLVESSRLAAMGLMAAGVAHEVNTPLGAIQLSNELAQKSLAKKPEAVSSHLRSIERATERAQKAVERILYYAKPMGGESKETVVIAEVVSDALELLSHRIARARCSLELEVPEHLTLTGERQALYTLLFNLVLNGLEASGTGEGAVIWIRCGETSDRIVLEVEDSGTGVPDAVASRIFEPFFTTRPSGEGTGLGLHLARQAAELFGGSLRLVPSRGHGAIFRAEFPRTGS